MQTMYPGVENSPKTELVAAITATDTEIEVSDVSVLLQPEGLAVIGNGEGAETIKYSSVDGNVLKDCVRGFQGTAKPWGTGTRLARNFTAYDHDAFKTNIEDHDTAITELEDRFDTVDLNQLALQPGLQVVDAAKDARFKLGEIKGRTLINLRGNYGSGESVAGWIQTGVSASVDTSVKHEGRTSSIKMTASSTVGEHFLDLPNTLWMPVTAGKFYIVVGYIKPASAAEAMLRPITFAGDKVTPTSDFSTIVARVTDSSKFSFWNFAFQAAANSALATIRMQVLGENQVANFSEMAMYEITQAEYNALASMTPEQIVAKYPFVPSGIVGVENPYAIGYGENLLPPFYEWSTSNSENIISVKDPYDVTGNFGTNTASSGLIIDIPALPNQAYTLSWDVNSRGLLWVGTYDSAGVNSLAKNVANGESFVAPDGTVKLRISFYNTSTTETLKNPMLVLGTETKPFKPQRKSMLALQTTLHANPADGSEPDILFEKEGQYFRLAKWGKKDLDSSFVAVLGVQSPGYKVIRLDYPGKGGVGNTGFVTRYDGKLLTKLNYGASTTAADQFVSGSNGDVHIAVANTDSGWGDSYTPTADEIKAYFMGWTMYNGSAAQTGAVNPDSPANNLYNGTGTKAWARRVDGFSRNWIDGTFTLPTATAPNYKPYQFLYRLANNVVEPVPFEGLLMIPEGQSMVEVGTGVVLRERANSYRDPTTKDMSINVSSTTYLKYKADKILSLYADSRLFPNWTEVPKTHQASANGAWINAIGGVGGAAFDPAAAYSVTYIKLEKSPIVPIAGSLAANEKAQISDLTAGVADALQRVSVVEMEKAEKDAPGWLSPTLLNSAVHGSSPVRYKKLSNSMVIIEGIFVPVTSGLVFRLPVGYRPGDILRFPLISFDNAGLGVPCFGFIYPTGEVNIGTFGSAYASFDTILFLAEK